MEHFTEDMRKFFQEWIKNDPEMPERIRQRLKAAQEEKLKRRREALFGYEVVNGKLVINREESIVVKWIFERFLLYLENPPEELVKTALKRARSQGISIREISFEEAKSLVTVNLVKEYMVRELSLKELYYHALSEKNPTVRFEDILSLPMEALPKAGLEKLMSDISQLDIMRKQHEYSQRVNHILRSTLYNGTAELTLRPANRKGKMPLEHRWTVAQEHEPIISPEMFRAVQEKRQSHYKKPKEELNR